MFCSEIRENLVAYERGELAPDEALQVKEHLHDCPDCLREYETLQGFFSDLRQNIPPLEPSADFRRRLLDGLGMPAAFRAHARPSSRRLRRARKENAGVLERIRLRIRRSPYLAISMVAHAALIMLLTYVFVTGPWNNEKPESRTSSKEENIDQMRRNALSTRRNVDGNLVSLAGICEKATAVYLIPGDRKGSLWGFPTGGDELQENVFLSRINPEDRNRFEKVDIDRGVLALPERLLQNALGAAKEVVILAMPTGTPRIEIWNTGAWEDYLHRVILIDTRLARNESIPSSGAGDVPGRGTVWRREDDTAAEHVRFA